MARSPRLIQQLGHGGIGLGSAAFGCFLEQPAELDMGLLLGIDRRLQADRAAGERLGPGVHGDPERPAGQLLYVTLGDPRRNGRIARLSVIRSPDRGGGEVGTTAELGAGERIRTADLPFTRSTASCNMRATCADDTDHRTDGTHHAGIIWRAGRRTGPQPRRPFPAVLLLCVTSPRAPIRPGRAGSAAQIRAGLTR
jgi:hypothetical protein